MRVTMAACSNGTEGTPEGQNDREEGWKAWDVEYCERPARSQEGGRPA